MLIHNAKRDKEWRKNLDKGFQPYVKDIDAVYSTWMMHRTGILR